MPTGTDNYTTLRSWLSSSSKQASDKKGGLPDLEDGGRAVSEGARASEHSSDIKKNLPGINVESQEKNPEEGTMDKPIPDSGLKQTTTGKMPEVENAVKTVEREAGKAASADLSTDAGISSALESLDKVAAQMDFLLKGSVAATAAPGRANVAQPSGAATPSQIKASADLAVTNIIEDYRKYGADRGLLAARYIQGYGDAAEWFAKAADDGSLMQMMQMMQGAGAGAAGGAPGGAPPQMPPDAAGGGVPPQMPPDAAGGAPPMPPGAEMGGGGGGPEDAAGAMNELHLAPQEIEALIAMLQKQLKGQQGAEMPPADKEAVAKTLNEASKTVKAAAEVMRNGRYQFKPAADGTPERVRRERHKTFFRELQRAAS